MRKLLAEYKLLKQKSQKINDSKLLEKIKEIEHRYYHETGNNLSL